MKAVQYDHHGGSEVLVVNQLVWSADGRGVHTVLVDGRPVVENGHMTTIDEAALRGTAAGRADHRPLRGA